MKLVERMTAVLAAVDLVVLEMVVLEVPAVLAVRVVAVQVNPAPVETKVMVRVVA